MALNFLRVQRFIVNIVKELNDEFLDRFTDTMVIEVPQTDELECYDWVGLLWSVKCESKIRMKLIYDNTYEIELCSSCLPTICGYGYIWRRSNIGDFVKVAGLTITNAVDGNIVRTPNCEPEPYFIQLNSEEVEEVEEVVS
jgi:hypothetical protein